MYLELHDTEEGNTLVAGIENIDFIYQAIQWIKETKDNEYVVRWELKDKEGGTTIKKWERPEGSSKFPKEVA